MSAYYLYILPNQEAEKQAFERKKYEDEQAKIEAEKAKQESEDEEKQNNLDYCLIDADIQYSQNWKDYCAIWKLEVKDTYEDCKKQFSYMGDQEAKDFCWPNTPDYNEDDYGSCYLPSKYSDKVESMQKEAKDDCYRKYS